ncbi:l-threonine ammonia-lyase [Tribonema minus]|uniref:Threonine dehydratase n=1 Tax=Tribonema minus TaxID=303371 RepID=A0A835ZD82_9STRA|nr:l-threonine ammonia-lyase [Tribonema minus]
MGTRVAAAAACRCLSRQTVRASRGVVRGRATAALCGAHSQVRRRLSSEALEEPACSSNGGADGDATEEPFSLNSYLNKVLNARVYDVAVETPLQPALNLSNMLQNTVLLKREDLQPVFSFKIRGAYNKIASCTPQQLARGVVTCSAGNHAQGVAMSAARLGIKATIVMPLATPQIKVNAVRTFGGPTVTIKLHGQNYDEASDEAKRLVKEEGLVLVHPFDDPEASTKLQLQLDVIAGQGTVAHEILKARNGKPLDIIFACVGGGGLVAGIAAYVKAVRPEVRVVGVEARDAAGMTASLQAGKVVSLQHVGLFADGAAVRVTGSETFRVASALVDDMITVSTDEICQAIKFGFNDTRCVMEPAGALAIAGAAKYLKDQGLVGLTVAAVTSGANMDFDRLRFVSERADSSETLISVTIPESPGICERRADSSEPLVFVTIPESPGSFRALYRSVFPRNVTEFSYRYHDGAAAQVLLSYQSLPGVARAADAAVVLDSLTGAGYRVMDLSDNELAKDHARHFVGGRAHAVANERLYRFEFPEAPGALSRFLNALQFEWNISLFHYRNHGSDFGRVLVPAADDAAFGKFLDELGYEYYDETRNPVYTQFFSGAHAH